MLEKNQKAYDELKIIDFGTGKYYEEAPAHDHDNGEENESCKKEHSNGSLSEVTGTPYYIAPEVIQQNYGSKCDIWSCGVIAFVLLSGTPPFSGRNQQEIMKNITEGSWKFRHTTW